MSLSSASHLSELRKYAGLQNLLSRSSATRLSELRDLAALQDLSLNIIGRRLTLSSVALGPQRGSKSSREARETAADRRETMESLSVGKSRNVTLKLFIASTGSLEKDSRATPMGRTQVLSRSKGWDIEAHSPLAPVTVAAEYYGPLRERGGEGRETTRG